MVQTANKKKHWGMRRAWQMLLEGLRRTQVETQGEMEAWMRHTPVLVWDHCWGARPSLGNADT